jgi:hypothetical protein
MPSAWTTVTKHESNPHALRNPIHHKETWEFTAKGTQSHSKRLLLLQKQQHFKVFVIDGW